MKMPDATPMANALLAVAQTLDLDIPKFGDSRRSDRPERGPEHERLGPSG